MKKFIITIVSVVFVSTMNVCSQTCINAVKHTGSLNVAIPPPGTISPAGPDLGCLSLTHRQMWFYTPICDANYLTNFVGWLGANDSVGLIFYGPFDQKVTNCADMDASKILFCTETKAGAGGNLFITHNDTLLEGKYYYTLLTISDAVLSTNVNSFQLGMNPIMVNCFECNDKVSVMHGTNNAICIATVDTAINKCKIMWNESSGVNVAGYKILRQSNLANVYDTVSIEPVSNLSEFIDNTSSPIQKSYTYSVLGYDSCDNSLLHGYNLTTAHLISFAGTNNVAQLIWNNVYTGNGGFDPQYYIHRYNAATGWQLIDSIGITLPIITYTDIYAPAGLNSYTVELRKTVACVPMRVTSTAYQSVFSNVTYVNVTNVEELANSNQFNIFPNPATSTIQLTFNTKHNGAVKCEIWNVMGERVWASPLTPKGEPGNVQLDVSFLAKGMYVVRVGDGTAFENKKLVMQ